MIPNVGIIFGISIALKNARMVHFISISKIVPFIVCFVSIRVNKESLCRDFFPVSHTSKLPFSLCTLPDWSRLGYFTVILDANRTRGANFVAGALTLWRKSSSLCVMKPSAFRLSDFTFGFRPRLK